MKALENYVSGYKKTKNIVDSYCKGILTKDEAYSEMKQLDRSEEIDDNDWVYFCNEVQ